MEENRKGPGIFYAVVGVATLVVAIIGATFAYFSASATVTGGDTAITGGTNNDLSTALTADVTVKFHGAGATSGEGLVPSDLDNTATKVNNAVAAECIDEGYTGCHLYQIHIKSSQAVSAVDLKLASLAFTTTAPKDKTAWKYVIYRGNDDATDASANMAATNGLVADSADGFEATDVSIRTDGLTAGTDYYYYLLVYIANDAAKAQNKGDEKDVIGSYKGTVTFTAAGGGQVSASFAG